MMFLTKRFKNFQGLTVLEVFMFTYFRLLNNLFKTPYI